MGEKTHKVVRNTIKKIFLNNLEKSKFELWMFPVIGQIKNVTQTLCTNVYLLAHLKCHLTDKKGIKPYKSIKVNRGRGVGQENGYVVSDLAKKWSVVPWQKPTRSRPQMGSVKGHAASSKTRARGQSEKTWKRSRTSMGEREMAAVGFQHPNPHITAAGWQNQKPTNKQHCNKFRWQGTLKSSGSLDLSGWIRVGEDKPPTGRSQDGESGGQQGVS